MDDWFNESRSSYLYFQYSRKNNKFDFYTDTFDKFLLVELEDELQQILDFSNFTDDLLENEIIGPRIIKTSRKLETAKGQTDGYTIQLMGYVRSTFRDFESYVRIVDGLDEDDIQFNFETK